MKLAVKWVVLTCAMMCPLTYAHNEPVEATVSDQEIETVSEAGAAQTQSAATDAEPAKDAKRQDALDNQRLFTIASGYANGVYYMFGTLISALASHPTGSLSCDKGGTCGADHTMMINLSSEGSLVNLDSLAEGRVDSAFAQSNIAYWAYTASGLYETKEPQQNLRAIASFYPEMMHLVVSADSDIKEIADLSGKVVSLGAVDSGTLINVRQVLKAFGIEEDSFEAKLIDLKETTTLFESGDIDAFFFVGGLPTPVITHLASIKPIALIPITDANSDAFLSDNKYYTTRVIPAGTYPGVDYEVKTFAVAALWLTNDSSDEDMIYTITKAIWALENRPYWMEQLLPIGGLDVNHALDGIGIPLHPGAKRYYNEIGKRF